MTKEKETAQKKSKGEIELPAEELVAKLARHKKDLARITAEMDELVRKIQDRDKPKTKGKSK